MCDVALLCDISNFIVLCTRIQSTMNSEFKKSTAKFPQSQDVETSTLYQLHMDARYYASQDFLSANRFETILDADRYSAIFHYLGADQNL